MPDHTPPNQTRPPVPFLDLKAQQARIATDLRRRLDAVLAHCQFVLGPEVAELEAELARFCGAAHCVSVSSGTDALQIAMMAEGIGPGDAVFLPAFTYTATDGREIHESHTQTYDPIAQILRLTSHERWHDGDHEHTRIAHLSLRFNFPQELAALLTHHGFTIIHRYGDWDRSPLTPTSRSIIVVCRKTS